jgi:LysR family transcriptional regulator, transcriptional activator of nhaA
MDSLNYHHLLYFRAVAREGGLVAAARSLRLSHPTLSAQIHALEDRLGEKLFTKVGRKLALTEQGRLTLRYADEIFDLGRELVETVQGRATDKPMRLDVGIVDVLPKLLVRRLLEPALALPQAVRLVCHEDPFERLLGDLAQHHLDIVIADSPVPSGSAVRAHHHLLGESAVGLFAAGALAKAYRTDFPACLDGAPMLLPTETLTLRRSLNAWFDRHHIRPRIVAEFDDSALLKVFGADGVGVFPAPDAVADEIEGAYQSERLGRAEGVVERFYAISAERRIKHPAVMAITEAAQNEVFKPVARTARSPSHRRTGPGR